jgi:hypothetical protein
MKNTDRSRRILANRESKFINGKLVSVNREANRQASATDRERKRISRGEYYFVPRKTGKKTYQILSREIRDTNGRKEIVWDISRFDGKPVLTEKVDGKQIEHKIVTADLLAQCWNMIEGIEG